MKESKFDLLTAVGVFIGGVILAFLITNVFLTKPQDEKFKAIDHAVSSTLSEPDPEIFNMRALNPTVEVCVGCSNSSDEDEIYDFNYDDFDWSNNSDNDYEGDNTERIEEENSEENNSEENNVDEEK